LEKQKQHFGVKVTFFGTDRKRYQIEIPESQVKKVGPGYELQSQRKGFKRYYTAEAKARIIIIHIFNSRKTCRCFCKDIKMKKF